MLSDGRDEPIEVGRPWELWRGPRIEQGIPALALAQELVAGDPAGREGSPTKLTALLPEDNRVVVENTEGW